MIGPIVYGTLVLAGLAVLQSTVLQFIEIGGAAPDLVLVALVFLANKNGSMVGQVSGFVGGIILDVIGLAPLGFYALVYVLIGALFGISRGKMFVDPIFLPVLLILIATLLKALLALLVAGMFGVAGVREAVFSAPYAIELVYSGLVGPIAFAAFGTLRFLQPDRRKGEFV